MEKPDFAKYSEVQLRQILTRIDQERFPDRVEEIRARLARLEAERPAAVDVAEPTPNDSPAGIAGFWRRAAALLIDFLLLALVGLLLGLFLRDQFEAMGAWGRALGFFIALAYFGTMESRLFQGRTFGKLALDIKLVAADGAPLGLRKALSRSAVFCVPYFLNNANLGTGQTVFSLTAIQTILVLGLGGPIVYLSLFNRRTRQSVHDLLANAVVVRAGTAGAPRLPPVWKGHIAVVAALFAVATGAVAFSHTALTNGSLQPLLAVQRQVAQLRGVTNAGVFRGTSFATGGKRVDFLSINAVTDAQAGDDWPLARNIAQTAFAAYPDAVRIATFSVTVVRGYDIGIASQWRSRTFNATPDAWRDGRVAHD